MNTTYTAQETADELRQSLAAIVDHPDAFVPLRRQFAEEILAHLDAITPQANALATIQSTIWRLNGYGPAAPILPTAGPEDGPANVEIVRIGALAGRNLDDPEEPTVEASVLATVARETPADWPLVPGADDLDLIGRLDAGETTWRKIGADDRERLTMIAIANIRAQNNGITCEVFDEQRPSWMSKSNALFKTMKWSDWVAQAAERYPITPKGGDDGEATPSFRHAG